MADSLPCGSLPLSVVWREDSEYRARAEVYMYTYLQLLIRLHSQRKVLLLGTLLLFCQDILHLQR